MILLWPSVLLLTVCVLTIFMSVLAKRGMRRIHLVDRENELGGAMRWIPKLPGLGEWGRLVNYRQIQIDKLRNIEFIHNTSLEPDAVIVVHIASVLL